MRFRRDIAQVVRFVNDDEIEQKIRIFKFFKCGINRVLPDRIQTAHGGALKTLSFSPKIVE